MKTGGIEKRMEPGCRLNELGEPCGQSDEEGKMGSVGIWRCGVKDKESESGMCPCEDMGEKVSKANEEPFSDGGEWRVCREFVEWN